MQFVMRYDLRIQMIFKICFELIEVFSQRNKKAQHASLTKVNASQCLGSAKTTEENFRTKCIPTQKSGTSDTGAVGREGGYQP